MTRVWGRARILILWLSLAGWLWLIATTTSTTGGVHMPHLSCCGEPCFLKAHYVGLGGHDLPPVPPKRGHIRGLHLQGSRPRMNIPTTAQQHGLQVVLLRPPQN